MADALEPSIRRCSGSPALLPSGSAARLFPKGASDWRVDLCRQTAARATDPLSLSPPLCPSASAWALQMCWGSSQDVFEVGIIPPRR